MKIHKQNKQGYCIYIVYKNWIFFPTTKLLPRLGNMTIQLVEKKIL